ncbi:tyrosine-type recombinase/integrase [Vibrio alginolyticus]|uniref:tyrosine-type recombinase/integrase n=1 Tax=Vibrio alginolyticus TaxID=663 RepID=UPI001BD3E28A|nr:site-specific integrase [Vibrio alginolyticus]MBS9935776.1 site-specific integrase [Vibrio alginolyticus]
MNHIKVDDKLFLLKTKYSPNWYACYLLPTGEVRKSTRTTEQMKATTFAIRMKIEIDTKLENGVPLNTRNTFEKYAKRAIKQMTEEAKQKPIYASYARVLNSCCIPFFGKLDIKQVDHAELIKYFRSLGSMSLTQLRTRQAALKRVFTEAVVDKTIKGIPPMPRVETNSSEVRDPITKDEQKRILAYYDTFIDDSIKQQTKAKRTLLREYITILGNSGVRAGEEMKFSFADLEFNNDWYIQIKKGKVKDKKKRNRRVLLNKKCQQALINVAKYHGLPESLEKLQHIDKPVFAINNAFPAYNETFKQLTDKLNIDKTLYSYRHTYITNCLTNGIDIQVIANQCGTSSEMIQKHYSHLVVTSDKLKDIEFERPKRVRFGEVTQRNR